MQICPKCSATYEGGITECPKDNTALEPMVENLQKNPTIEEVVQVATHEMTAVVDLEKMEAMRFKAQAEAEERAAHVDPEATGTLLVTQNSQQSDIELTQEAHPISSEEEMTGATQFEDDTQNIRRTDISQNQTNVTSQAMLTQSGLTRSQKLFAIVCILALSIFSLIYYLQHQSQISTGASLLVTTVPTQAEVWVDSQMKGESPLQLTLPTAFYDLEIKKEGYESFRDIVELKSNGFTLAQSLKPKKEVDSNSTIISADQLIEQIHLAMKGEDLRRAWLAVKRFIQKYPNDPRGLGLLEKLGEQKLLRKQNAPNQANSLKASHGQHNIKSWTQRFSSAQKLLLLNEKTQAKILLTSLHQERPNKPGPHRLLARITLSENDIEATRYHLQKYLQLGGGDSDGQVKKWLKEHPPH